ncbi:hypothetical protein H7X68_03995 [Candidatus Saccharibacteria bacterium]|nr:hypothetical protein [Candidatus Saccharibacteria bacterium]
MEPTPRPQESPDQPDDVQPSSEQGQMPKEPYFNEDTFVQPESSPDISEPVAVDNQFDSSPVNNSPVNEPITPPSPVAQDVITTTPVEAVVPTTVEQTTKKKSLLWLWIILGATLLITASIIAGFFVVKGAADTSARTYTANVKNYLDDVYDATTSAADDPSDVKKAIDATKAPALEAVTLGGVSGDYAKAEKLKTEVSDKVSSLTSKISGYADVHAFYTEYTSLYTDLKILDINGAAATEDGSKSLISSYLRDFQDKLKEVKKLTDDAALPSELGAKVKDLGLVYDAMHTNWSAMTSAFDNSNEAAYDAAYNKYVKSNNDLSDAESPITEYYNDLSSKTRDAAKELKNYKDTIK